MDFWQQKDKVVTSAYKNNLGWSILKCTFDNIFSLYGCENQPYIEQNKIYEYGLFVDVCCEFPIYFFKSFDEALDFTRRVKPSYPYDRLMYWLRFQREYWLSTNLIEYNDYLTYVKDARLYYRTKNKQML